MKLPKRPYLIAVTGGIASGKTLFCKELENRGMTVYYSDIIAHSILEEEEVKKRIIDKFGEIILTENRKINREILRDVVFNNAEKLKYLNQIIHPEVSRKIQKIIDSSKQKMIFFEIPLLVENGLERAFDLTINIHSERELQIKRLKEGRQISSQKAEQIIKSQIDPLIRIERTDFTVYNNGDRSGLMDQLNLLLERISEFPFKDVIKITDI